MRGIQFPNSAGPTLKMTNTPDPWFFSIFSLVPSSRRRLISASNVSNVAHRELITNPTRDRGWNNLVTRQGNRKSNLSAKVPSGLKKATSTSGLEPLTTYSTRYRPEPSFASMTGGGGSAGEMLVGEESSLQDAARIAIRQMANMRKCFMRKSPLSAWSVVSPNRSRALRLPHGDWKSPAYSPRNQGATPIPFNRLFYSAGDPTYGSPCRKSRERL